MGADVSARDDYPLHRALEMLNGGPSALDELDRLRALNARLERDFADMNQLDPIVDRIGDINIHHGERDDGTGACLCGRESYLACPHWPEGGVAGFTWVAAQTELRGEP